MTTGEELEAWAAVTQERVEKLLAANPDLPRVTAFIVAQDQLGAEQVERRIAAGLRPEVAVWLVGSYARWQFALKHCPRSWIHANIAELWRSSDPDDEDPASLSTWLEACAANGYRTITDGKPLPRRKLLTIYRGQLDPAKSGIAWTLDLEVAKQFARGASYRQPMPGSVLEARIQRDTILGYLTGRDEQEVIVDPQLVSEPTVIGRYALVPKP
jgi:hypothetical protein